MTNVIWQFLEPRYQVNVADAVTGHMRPDDEDEVDESMEVYDEKVSGGHSYDEDGKYDAHWYQLLKN